MVDPLKIPQHIAIIMDGNGRWAKQRGLPRIAGHREGAESLRAVLRACIELGVKYLTVYAFSTENWRRPKAEVDFLLDLFALTIDRETDELIDNQIKVNYLGDLSKFPKELQAKMAGAMERTKKGTRITFNIMVNYGGRAELVESVNQIIGARDKGQGAKVTEEEIQEHLYTRGMPDPDLLIRTASELRVSNFLLWQIAYSEIYVTDLCWPDFRKEALCEAVAAYQRRLRKFGQTEEQVSAA